MENILHETFTDYTENIKFSVNHMEKVQEINWNKIDRSKYFIWGSAIEDGDNKYLFMRTDDSNSDYFNFTGEDCDEKIYKYKITFEEDKIKLVQDEDFKLDMHMANHNFRIQKIIKDNKNYFYFMGGKPLKVESIPKRLSDKFNKYIKNDMKVMTEHNRKLHDIRDDFIGLIDHDHFCPFYGNGHYIYNILDINNFKESKLVPLTNDKPTINSTLLGGNRDANYKKNRDLLYKFAGIPRGPKRNMEHFKKILSEKWNTKECFGGFLSFDSLGSLLYNENDKKYYFYHRANILPRLRQIQYTSSYDLINWSSWDTIKFSKNQNDIYTHSNLYMSNFFKLKGLNGFFGILIYNKTSMHRKAELKIRELGSYKLVYSEDCITWDMFDDFVPNLPVIWENTFSICGDLIEKDNKYLFFSTFTPIIINQTERKVTGDCILSVCSIDKNRFIYANCEDVTKPGKIITKLLKIEDPDNIFFNFTTYENGYIEVRLLDKDKKMVKPYTSSRFYKIGSNCNHSKYQLKWNKKKWDKNNKNYKEINFKEFHIEITGMNFKLYSISW